MLKEDLGDHGFEVAQAEGKEERVIEETEVGVVDYLKE